MITLTRRDIAKRLKERPLWKELTQEQIETMINDFLEEVKRAVLHEDYAITFRGFGRFFPRVVNKSHAPTREGKTVLNSVSYKVLGFNYSKKESRVKLPCK
ncbi:HU family DNA-binding protein [Phorcysia thermohydrogeniphila]|uniref:DNA-binding protein n=1 Tax=Phorcysia thermohydrogeniphila TaxID=936138 RepID=A0A4V2PDS3_9BACT|nr:HU family DNA-binding protein [Phorcysia thermohydrogeniphila]TCK06366.1 DNA-binding protein [Phorcysia thermohydrogeniphila]